MQPVVTLAAIVLAGIGLAHQSPMRLSGMARVSCRSDWHQIDLPLRVRAARVPGLDVERLLKPPAGATRGGTWEVSGEAVQAIVRALQDAPWEAGGRGEAYSRWLGAGPTGSGLTVRGSLTVTLGEAGGVRLLRFSGTLRTTDEGWMANRFGPNSWRDEWEHRVTGWARLDPGGSVVALDLRDRFAVAGLYFNPGGGKDPNVRSGTLQLVGSPPRPLSAADQREVRTLVARLADGRLDVRQGAADALIEWARRDERVGDLIRAIEATETDPEERSRLVRIRRQLLRD